MGKLESEVVRVLHIPYFALVSVARRTYNQVYQVLSTVPGIRVVLRRCDEVK
jgi:hypothetical protein